MKMTFNAWLTRKIYLLVSVALFFSFCVITNNQGRLRVYQDGDLPFVYQLNSTTPPNWIPVIDAGANVWVNSPSNYFEFNNGGLTNTTSLGRDFINLVFFDAQGVNFPTGTNTIAFSSTWTQGSGDFFRAVESDLIWNARDFPAGINGEPGLIDLEGTIAHEFGHHMGLAHAGPVGGPPGCGELLPASTMFGTVAFGDTTQRSLELDDLANAAIAYPVWEIAATVTNSSGDPLPEALLRSDTPVGAIIGPVESPQNGFFEIPGAVFTDAPLDQNGEFNGVSLGQTVVMEARLFGFSSTSQTYAFNPPGGIGQTQNLSNNFVLDPSPTVALTGSLTADGSGENVAATISAIVTSDKPNIPEGIYVSESSIDGSYSISLLANEDYQIIYTPEAPFAAQIVDISNLSVAGQQIDISFEVASVLLVNDDTTSVTGVYLEESIGAAGRTYHRWDIETQGTPDANTFALFPDPKITVWYTGSSDAGVLNEAEQQELATFLDNGGNLFLTGQNIAESDTVDLLLTNYLSVEYLGVYGPPSAKGVDGDLIADGLSIFTNGGPANQRSKDRLTIGANGIVSINYGPTGVSGPAAARFEDATAGWKSYFMGFGLEGINNTEGVRDQIMVNVLNWFDNTVNIDRPREVNGTIPQEFQLSQNYPNPFNPSTTIQFAVPQTEKVTISVFNNLGQEVRELLSRPFSQGRYEIVWDGRDNNGNVVPSGTYFYRLLSSSGQMDVRKMTLLK